MAKDITWVALDTSKKGHVVAVLFPGEEEPRVTRVANEKQGLRRLARKLVREAPGEVRVCYEAGPCGFGLKRELEEATEGLSCEVVAPGLIPVRPGQRVKTDRRDACKLVRLYRAGELTTVQAPTVGEEGARDLMRCREDAKQDLLRARHRLGKFLLRRGRVYTCGRAWTQKHDQWLKSMVWEQREDAEVFDDYRLAISQIEDRLRGLDGRIEALSQEAPYREPVGWLRCFRGIDTVTAMTTVCEVHGFSRFQSAGALMAYLGLVPTEHSSGDRRRQGGITKTGNSHVRRVLVESAWTARHKPAVGYKLRKRRQGQPAWAIAHADRAMRRLWRRYHYLEARGKPQNKIVAAVARELVGFIWAMLQEGSLRNETQRGTGIVKGVRGHHGVSRRVA